jgi:hypothetical protein
MVRPRFAPCIASYQHLEDLQILFVVSTVYLRHPLIAFRWRCQHQQPLAMCGLVKSVAPGARQPFTSYE